MAEETGARLYYIMLYYAATFSKEYLTLLMLLYAPLHVQRWIRPAPEGPTETSQHDEERAGECMDYNEADPLLLVENVSQAVVAPRRHDS